MMIRSVRLNQLNLVHLSFLAALMVLLLPSFASAQCATWNQTTGVITDENGNVIGQANLTTNRAEDAQGNPLSASGVDCVIGDPDQVQYDSDDLGQGGDDDGGDDDGGIDIDPCIIPGLCGDPGDGGPGPGPGPGPDNPDGPNNPGGNNDQNQEDPLAVDPEEAGADDEAAAATSGLASWIRCVDSDGDSRDAAPADLANNVAQVMRTALCSGAIFGGRILKNVIKQTITAADKTEQAKGHEGEGGEGGEGGTGGDGGGGGGNERPSIGEHFSYQKNTELPAASDLGVDDEVFRVTLATYQPVHRLQKDFLEDKNARNDYLNHALTLRGVTVMAMGFLDKTLGAGLATLQEQADNNAMQHLLKQVSWTTNRMANPDRGRVYQDLDEKMEACLEYAITWGHSDNKIEPGESPKKHVWYDQCPEECGETPDDKDPARYSSVSRKQQEGQEPQRMGNGSYAYCSCCAEMSQTLNALSDKNSGGGGDTAGGAGGGQIRKPIELEGQGIDEKELFTLAERAFYGLHSESDSQGENSIDRGLQMFKRIYGDVVLSTEEVDSTKNKGGDAGGDAGGGAGGAAGGNSKSKITTFAYRYQMPKWSPQKLVALYRNRCNHSDKPNAGTLTTESECSDDDEKDFGVKYGVCPALWNVLENWQAILKQSAAEDQGGDEATGDIGDWKRWWAEASMGQPMNGHNIKALVHLHGDSAKQLKVPKGILARVLEAYCDAAALGALTRKHTMLKAHFLDMLTLSQALTAMEKQRLINLMERYTHYLSITEQDVSSKFMAQASLSGVTMQYERYLIHTAGSAGQGMVNLAGRSQNISSLRTLWGGNPVAGEGGGNGGVFERRKEPNFTQAERSALSNAEITRDALDPISRTLRRITGR